MTSAALTVYYCEYVTPVNLRSRLDGDTFRCLGNVSSIIPDSSLWVPKVRLIRVNAPETGKPGAEIARDLLIDWLRQDPFTLHCYARDKYGRLLADAELNGTFLSQYMLDKKVVEPMSLDIARELMPGVHEGLIRAVAHPLGKEII